MIKLIAELSMNHLGDMNLAKKMILAARSSGANYVKFQTWQAKNLKPGPWDLDGRRETYEKAELTTERHADLKKFCDNEGIRFLTSCFAIQDLERIRPFTDEIKIPSSECRNRGLVHKAIDMFEKVYVSTGATFAREYEEYARFPNVFLLHCVSSYPCPPEQANLRRILFMKTMTQNVGYSGHCIGVEDAIAAISLGATVVEKHFTTDQSLPFRDNKFAILPHDMEKLRDYADMWEAFQIDHGTDFQACETSVREEYYGRWSYGMPHS